MNEQAIHPEISNAHQELEYIAEFLGRSNARAFVEYNPILVTHKNIFVVTSSHVAKKRIAYPVVFAQNSFVSI
jgi:hypothetical protein